MTFSAYTKSVYKRLNRIDSDSSLVSYLKLSLDLIMRIFHAVLLSEIHWRIRDGDPLQQSLLSLPGMFFVNPLLYSKLSPPQLGVHAKIVAIANDQAVVRTNGLLLGTNQVKLDTNSIPFKIELPEVVNLDAEQAYDSSFYILFAYIEHLATSLRLKSRQTSISRNLLGGSWIDCEQLPELNFPQSNPDREILFQRYVWDTAVTWKHLIDADGNLVSRTTPVYEGLILDAIHAFADRDFRRVLLYSAISIETATAVKFDEVAKLKGGNDPIYKFLSEKGRFSEHLHEIPLHLLGRSLLIENAALYQNAIKLYRTRNKIAHLGEPPLNEQSYFEIDEKSALAAIQCAIQVFQWLGEDVDFPIPQTGFVKLGAPLEEDIHCG